MDDGSGFNTESTETNRCHHSFVKNEQDRNNWIQEKDDEISVILNQGEKTNQAFSQQFNKHAWIFLLKVGGTISGFVLIVYYLLAIIDHFRT